MHYWIVHSKSASGFMYADAMSHDQMKVSRFGYIDEWGVSVKPVRFTLHGENARAAYKSAMAYNANYAKLNKKLDPTFKTRKRNKVKEHFSPEQLEELLHDKTL